VKPILFSTEQVQAILEGRKTQTRRVIKPQPEFAQIYEHKGETLYEGENRTWCYKNHISPDIWNGIEWIVQFAPYQPGDILWVRETWYYEEHMHELTAGDPDLPSGRYKHRYIYKASDPDYPVDVGVGNKGWRSSIHMPREAARIFLKVKNVRVERLQDITEEDARAEGIPWEYSLPDGMSKELFEARVERMGFCNALESIGGMFNYKRGFQFLWNNLNANHGYGWETNPWVFVIEFERTEAEP